KAGFEPLSREIPDRLRRDEMSTHAAEAAIRAHRGRLRRADSQAVGVREARKRKEVQPTRLYRSATTLKAYAADELGKPPSEVRDFLQARGIIPEAPRLTMQGLARILTPADARVLVQELAGMAPADPTRGSVIRSLRIPAGEAAGRSNHSPD